MLFQWRLGLKNLADFKINVQILEKWAEYLGNISRDIEHVIYFTIYTFNEGYYQNQMYGNLKFLLGFYQQ